ncbi:hypothetical protein ACJX0J_016546, partial [Zea mays]
LDEQITYPKTPEIFSFNGRHAQKGMDRRYFSLSLNTCFLKKHRLKTGEWKEGENITSSI